MWGTISMNLKHSSVFANAVDTVGKTHMLHYLPNFIVAFNLVSVLLNTIGILSKAVHYDEASNATRPYVLMMHFPFDSNKQPWYLIVIILQFSYLLTLTVGAATINSVLIILVSVRGMR